MDIIEKRYEQPLSQDVAYYETPPQQQTEPQPSESLMVPILRRWYIILAAMVFICGVGLPIIWLFEKSVYESTAAIRVAPIINSVLFSDRYSEGVIPMYDNFKNTQADLIKSEQVLQRVADDLAGKNLTLFQQKNSLTSPITGRQDNAILGMLKNLVTSNGLRVASERKSELIKITMKGPNSTEVTQVIDAFVRAYMGLVVNEETKGGDQSLLILEDEGRTLSAKLEKQRQAIRELAQEYGTQTLDEYRQMKLQRVATLQAQLTETQTRKMTLQTQVELFQNSQNQTSGPEGLIRIRQEFINNDLVVKNLTTNIIEMEQSLMAASQTMAPGNPELKRRGDILEMFKKRLEDRRQEVNKNFDEMLRNEMENSDKNRLENAKAELNQNEIHEKYIQELMAKEDSETIELGRKQLAINDMERQLGLTEELYEKVRRRIQELEMERKRPARISVAYYANTLPVPSKRLKLSAALVCGSFACGVLLAFLRARMDRSVYTPIEVTKRIGVRVIGTTTGPNRKVPALPQQIVDDYQTICANLGLLNGDGIPNKLVVTSPATCEGKTTFAVNLATSLARSHKKVLLIDGDLRKPDIRDLLGLPRGERGLQELLFGRKLEEVVCSVPMAGFDVLVSDSRNMSDALELLARPCVSEYINAAAAKYDHVIIDSPPVLAFPDALLWARMSEGVVLTSFAGKTEEGEIKETLDRLSQVNIKVLGIVLNNVQVNYSYNRYGYGYGYGTNPQTGEQKHKRKHNKATLLLTTKVRHQDVGEV